MSARHVFLRSMQGACAALVLATANPAGAVVVNVNTTLSGLSMTAQDQVLPLATKVPADPCVIADCSDGYNGLNTDVTATLAATPSTMSASLDLVIDPLAFIIDLGALVTAGGSAGGGTPVVLSGSFSSSFDFHLAFSIVDDDLGRDFATGIADPLEFEANLAGMVTGMVDFTIDWDPTANMGAGDFTVGAAVSNPVVTSMDAKTPLGVDVNGNTLLDELSLNAEDFALGMQDLLFDNVDILSANFDGTTFDITSTVAVTAGSVSLSGGVQDASVDPPFTIDFLVDPFNFDPVAVPEPGVLALLGSGVVLLLAARRRRRA